MRVVDLDIGEVVSFARTLGIAAMQTAVGDETDEEPLPYEVREPVWQCR